MGIGHVRLAVLFAAFALAPTASAMVEIEWVAVGDIGNVCDSKPQGCMGGVDYAYQIGRYEVTNREYVEFLNAVAKSDANGLYSPEMGDGYGGIVRSGSPGSFSYSTRQGRADKPVNFVSFWDGLRFANWLHNGQPTGAQGPTTTEDGAYTLTPSGISNNSVMRNDDARVFLTSEDEWYKAAYYDPSSSEYFLYPAGSNYRTDCSWPTAEPNRSNCENLHGDLAIVGSYPGSPSPVGTFDQAGNVAEWNELSSDSDRGMRGGAFMSYGYYQGSIYRWFFDPGSEWYAVGFRVARVVPSPTVPALSGRAHLLLALAFAATAWWVGSGRTGTRGPAGETRSRPVLG